MTIAVAFGQVSQTTGLRDLVQNARWADGVQERRFSGVCKKTAELC